MIAERSFAGETPVVDLENVSLTYEGSDKPSLVNINLKIYEGEFICVLGPSGCGKSTLLSILAGFYQPLEGNARFDGTPIHGADNQRGVVFQQPPLYPWLTVAQNVAFGLKMRGVSSGERKRMSDKALEEVGLSDFADSRPYELSGGMKQRAAIARALVNKPRMLLMDEPFGALDALTRAQMQNLLRNLWADTGSTIFFITHDVDEALLLGTRVLVLSSCPGHILKELPVTFTYQITGENSDRTRFTDDFAALRGEILDLIEGKKETYSI